MLTFGYQRQTALVIENWRDSLRRSFAKKIYTEVNQNSYNVNVPQRIEPLIKPDGTHRNALEKSEFFDYFMMACRLVECSEKYTFMEIY